MCELYEVNLTQINLMMCNPYRYLFYVCTKVMNVVRSQVPYKLQKLKQFDHTILDPEIRNDTIGLR